jgi:MYXO-CTERM domain-containing protein
MKKLMIAVAALMVSIAAYGQGQFVFNNRIPPDINAKIVLADGTTGLSGTDYTVQLLAGPSGTPTAQLQPIATTDFRTGAAAGYVNALTPTVPGVGEGKNADVVLRVFQGAGTSGAALVDFGPYTVTLHESPNTPANLPMGTALLTVPEPSTLALGLIGLGALFAIRRRS